ncbi:hypothetical protein DFP72DRAFT_1042005, partial [Ephemerocybe angulata]
LFSEGSPHPVVNVRKGKKKGIRDCVRGQIKESKDRLPWDLNDDIPRWKKKIEWLLLEGSPQLIAQGSTSRERAFEKLWNATASPSRNPHATILRRGPYAKHSCKATGPSFEVPTAGPLGYSNIASCFQVKLDEDRCSLFDQVCQLGVYAEQVFNEQPNREFVRCVAISEKHALLVHFDRVGAQIFPIIDIHQDPFSFLRILFAQTLSTKRRSGWTPEFAGKFETAER